MEEKAMSMLIRCDCGHVVRGETEEELLAAAREHIRDVHPDQHANVSDDDLLAMAEEA
jgi:predicted small metal-binding protein